MSRDDSDRATGSDGHPVASRRGFLAAGVGAAVLGGLGTVALGQDEAVETILLGAAVPGWDGIAPSTIEGETNPTLSLTEGRTYRVAWVNRDGQPHNFALEDDAGQSLQVIRPVEIDRTTFDALANATEPGEAQGNMTLANLTANRTADATTPAGNETMANATDVTAGGNATGNATAGNETAGGDGEGDLVSETEIVAERGAVQALEFVATDDVAQYFCTVHPSSMVGDVDVGSSEVVATDGTANNSSG